MNLGPVQFVKTKGTFGWSGVSERKGGFSGLGGAGASSDAQAMAICASDPGCKAITVRPSDGYFLARGVGGQYALPSDGGWYNDWVTYTKKNTSGALTSAQSATLGGLADPKYKGAEITIDDAKKLGARDSARPVGRSGCGGFNNWGRDWKNNGFAWQIAGGACPEGFDVSLCPLNAGDPAAGRYTYNNNTLGIQCDYSKINMATFITPTGSFKNDLGSQQFSAEVWKQAKNDYCANWANIDKQECIGWLNPQNPGSASYNTVKMGLCASQADWTTDTRCVNAINQIFKTGSDSEKNMANQMVNLKCGTNPNSPACACYNATNRSVDDCLKTPDLPGCKSITEKVGKYKSLGATFMTTALKPFCACDECTQAKTGSAGKVISQPAADQPGLCADKINACFQNITVGAMSGGNLNAGCTIQDINPPPPPPPSGGAAVPPPPPAKPINPMGPTTIGAAVPPSGGAVPPPPPSGGSKAPATTSSTTAPASSGAAVGLGFGFCCLCVICCLIALFFMMKKKGKPA